MPNAQANKLIPVVDGTAGTPIELIDSRINTTSPVDGDVLVYNSTSGKFEESDISSVVPQEVFVCTYDDTNNTMDKTANEIIAAKDANKFVICKFTYPTTDYLILNKATNGPLIVFTGLASVTSNTSITSARLLVLRYTTTDGWNLFVFDLQQKLVSGTNIKTVNGNSLLGSGDLTIGGVTIYSGSTAPSSATGVDGDIYIQEV